jgi:hypothetical protein
MWHRKKTKTILKMWPVFTSPPRKPQRKKEDSISWSEDMSSNKTYEILTIQYAYNHMGQREYNKL